MLNQGGKVSCPICCFRIVGKAIEIRVTCFDSAGSFLIRESGLTFTVKPGCKHGLGTGKKLSIFGGRVTESTAGFGYAQG